MEIIPAIDLRGGRCVRLTQGNFDRETVFSSEPADVAAEWQAQGAYRLHVVDLDGAVAGKPCNVTAIHSIVQAVRIPVQVGGGIRSLASIQSLLESGVGRVILGTAAVRDPEFLSAACEAFGDQVAVGIDARDGKVAVQGWLETSGEEALSFAERVANLGARRVIYTDISRDGTLSEPNFAAYEALVGRLTVPVVASGGISSLAHLQRLKEAGVEGAIVGLALYKGLIDLGVAIRLCQEAA